MHDADMTHTDKVLRGLRQIGSARLLTQVLRWGLTAVTIRLLQPRDYGLIATAGIFTIFAQMLLDGGLAEVLVSQRELPHRLQGAAVTAVLLVSSFLALLMIAVAPMASLFFHSAQLRSVMDVSSFYLPLNALGVVPTAQLSKQMRFKPLAFAQTAGGITQAVSTVALAYAGEAYWSLIVGAFVGTGFSVAVRWLSVDHKPVPNLQLSELRPLVQNSSHMILQRLASFSIDNLDIFLVSRIWGTVALGSYSVARSLAHTVLDRISEITRQISIPAFAVKTERSDQLRGLTMVVSVTSTVIFPVFWTMGAVSQVAFPLIFGTKWTNLVIPFLAFTAILPLRTIYSLLNSSLIGTGRTGMTLKNTLSWGAILIPIMLIGVFEGPNGAALSWTVAFPIVFYVATRRIAKVFSISITELLKPLLIPAACAGASAVAAEGILLGLSTRVIPALILTFQCIGAAACYLLLIRSFSRSQYTQTLALFRRMVRV